MHEIFQKLKSTRGFIPKKIEKEKLDEILEAAHSAPSAGNLKAREILAVADEEPGSVLPRPLLVRILLPKRRWFWFF